MRGLSIGEAVERTGVGQATLRVWEARYGFPAPERLPSGHRRYSERDIDLVRRVVAGRATGAGLADAIERAIREVAEPARSLYAGLRQARPDLAPCRLTKRTLRALSRAIEDESLSRAELPLLFGSFQRERHYRGAEHRWRELARGAELTVAFADFQRMRSPTDGPIEIPVDAGCPLTRERAIVCDAPDHGVCLTAWEVPGAGDVTDDDRVFESIWSVEPAVVRTAARICAEIAGAQQPALVRAASRRLESPATAVAARQLTLAAAITNRTLSYVGDPRRRR